MAMSQAELRLAAVERYHDSVRQAEIRDYWGRISGKNYSLLKYEEVANRLHIRQQIPIGYHMVPLHQIVGSVGRYREFTNTFLPRPTVMKDRWVAVDATMNSLKGLPPVELYKIGEGYFVIDGNHRISVARANGNKDIEAIVIECQSNVAFTLKDFLGDEWLLKAARSDFLVQTHLDQLRPEQSFDVTHAEHYQTLLQHIAVHRYLFNQPRPSSRMSKDGYVLSWSGAVLSWYEKVYRPIVEAIRTQQVLARFPNRTETDLYILVTQVRERVAEEYELAPLDAETAVKVFAANHSERMVDRLTLTLRQMIDQRLPRSAGQLRMPRGMTEEEFGALRLRHAAGELSVTEARRKIKQETIVPLFVPTIVPFLSLSIH